MNGTARLATIPAASCPFHRPTIKDQATQQPASRPPPARAIATTRAIGATSRQGRLPS
jgi:hypothetical protein